jgi:outer membrane protein OmpA-like peptidoglycan-associated protein
VSPDEMRELAVQRGLAVKDYLATRQVAPERLFLGAPRTGEPKPSVPGAATEKAWQPSAELSLAAR